MNNDEKIYFTPGTLVVLKHEGVESPVMIVKEKQVRTYVRNGEMVNDFVGIKTQWFDKNHVLREGVFSTKDLKFYK